MTSVRTISDAVARYALLAQLALMPVFLIPWQAASIPQSKFVFSAMLLCLSIVAWVIARFAEGGARVPKSPLLAAVALLPLAYGLSALMSGSFLSSFVSGLAEQDTVAIVVLWFLMFLASALYVRSDERLKEAALAVLGGLALFLVVEVARILVPALQSLGGLFSSATVTTVGTWHDMGILVGLIAYANLALLQFKIVTAPSLRLVAWVLAVLSLLFLIVVSMADIWFVLSAVAALSAVLVLVREERRSLPYIARSAGPWIALALVSLVFGFFNARINDMLPERLSVTAVEVRPSWQGTLDISGDLMAGSRTLFFGSGPNSFAKNWVRYKPEGVNETLFWNFDFNAGVGTVPTSLVTLGIIGVLAWASLIATYLYVFGRSLRASGAHDARIAAVLGFSVLYLLVFQIIYVPGVVGSLLLFALLGLFAGYLAQREHVAAAFGMRSLGQFAGGAAIALPALIGLVVLVPGLRAVASDIALNQSVRVFAEDRDVAQATARVQYSLSLWSSNDRAHRAAVELGLLELARLSQAGVAVSQEQLQATLAQTIEHGLSAVQIDDADYQNWLTLAQLYQELSGAGVQGSLDEARKAYREVIADNPSNPIPHVRLAQLAIAENDLDGGLQHLNDAIGLKQNLALAHYLRAQVLAQKGDLQGALASAAAVVQIAPQDPVGWYTLGLILYSAQAWNDAGTAFAQAAVLRPDFANAYFMYGLAAANVGEFGQAAQAFMKVAELDPSQTAIPQMIANVSQGRPALEGLVQ